MYVPVNDTASLFPAHLPEPVSSYRSPTATARAIDRYLGDLPPRALAPTAAFLAAVARELDAMAAEYAAREERRAGIERRADALRTLPAIIDQLMRRGLDFDQATRLVSRESGSDPDQLALLWRDHRAKIETAARAARRHRIMQLRRLGESNPAIAAKLGLHQKSVARIIREELRAAGQAPALGSAAAGAKADALIRSGAGA